MGTPDLGDNEHEEAIRDDILGIGDGNLRIHVKIWQNLSLKVEQKAKMEETLTMPRTNSWIDIVFIIVKN